MAIKEFMAKVIIDSEENTVELRGKFGNTLAKMKFEGDGFGTWERVNPLEDCDNYWIGLKPADSMIFGNPEIPKMPTLFTRRTNIIVQDFRYSIVKR